MKIISISRFKGFSIFAFTFFLLCTGTVFSQGLSEDLHLLQPTEVAYPDYGVEIGAGWDLFLGRKTGSTCIEFIEIDLPKTSFESDVRLIKNSYQLANSQYAKLSGSVDWGFINASASAEVDRKRSIHQDSVSVVSTIVVEAGSTQVANIRSLSENEDVRLNAHELSAINRGSLLKFSKDVLAVLNSTNEQMTNEKKRAWFRQTCGTGYIATVRRGARVSVLTSKLVKKDYERQQLHVKAQASSGGVSFRGQVQVKADKARETGNQDSEITLKIRQEGGSALISVTLNDKLSDVAEKLDGAGVYVNPTSFSALVMPYITVSGSDFNLVASSFPMKEYSALYYFMSDTLNGYNNTSEYLYSKRYSDTNESQAPFSPLSLAVSGGHNKVVQRRAVLRQSIGALVSAIQECYYKNARLGLDGNKNAKLGLDSKVVSSKGDSEECSIEDSLASARAEYSPKFLENEDLNGLNFLLTSDERKTIRNGDEKKSRSKNVQHTLSKLDISIRFLIEDLYIYAAGLPLSDKDLSVEKAGLDLDIDVWEIWTDTTQESSQKTNKNRLLDYIVARVFYLRLHPLREELCELNTHPDFCWSDAQLHHLLRSKAKTDFKITSTLFPKVQDEKTPSIKKVVPMVEIPFWAQPGNNCHAYNRNRPMSSRNYICP